MSTEGTVLKYQKARQQAMEPYGQSEDEVRQVAADHDLSEALTEVLVAVAIHWKKDNDAFSRVLEGVYHDTGNTVAERALAAENASSRYFFDGEPLKGLEWSWRSQVLVRELSGSDAALLTIKLDYGVWDTTDVEPTQKQRDNAMWQLINLGGFDASGRVAAWVKELDTSDPDQHAGAVSWLEAVIAMDVEATAVNIFNYNWCNKKLEELRAGA